MYSASADRMTGIEPARIRRGAVHATAATFVMLLLCACAPASDEAAARPRPPQPVEVVEVTRRDLVEVLTLVGTARAWESAQIHPEVAGIVNGIQFDEGAFVAAGSVLITLDDSRLRAELDSALVAFRLAEQTLNRVASLRQSHNLAEADYDHAVAEFDRATADVALRRTLLAKTEIRAPFDGVVGARAISPGDYVTPQTTLVSVNDLSRTRITFEVPQRYLPNVVAGSRFQVRASGLSDCHPIHGEAYFVSATVNPATRASRVDGLVENPTRELRPGMFVNVDLVLSVREQAPTVPDGAIFMSASGPQVVVARAVGDGFEADFQPVELGLRSNGLVEVRGAEALLGQSVVAAGVGALALYPGTRLAPRPAVGLYEPFSQY